MNIVICDDEKTTCGELEQAVLEYAKKKLVKIHVEVFDSGDRLLEYLKKGGKADVLFLDICLPDKDGVQVGSHIRNTMGDEQMQIVYISSKTEYALQLFQNRPFDFLIKPVQKTDIFRTLDHILDIWGQGNAYFEYQHARNLYRIPYKDILYFRSAGKRIEVVLLGQEPKSFYGKLGEVEKLLPGGLFLNIHKSFLINRNYVAEYTYESVKMVNGDILSISKANRTSIRRQILKGENDGNMEW